MTQIKEPQQGWWDTLHQPTDKAVKTCIWILVAMCTALIVVTIYMAYRPMKLRNISTNHTAVPLERTMMDRDEYESTVSACQLVNNCTVECRNTTRIYRHVFKALQDSPCEEDLILNIHNQRFPHSMLTNKWIPANKAIKELSITNGNFSHIRNEAFNCIDFTNTQVLMLVGVNIPTLENGVLLGLSRLRSLQIVGKVGQIDRCFFQPIQTSLVRLRLGGELTISGESNIFGISYLPRIEALDLSDNIISGALTRKFFTAIPHVKYLTLSNSKIASIDEDAFDGIAGNLLLLDMSNNHLTSIDERSIERILALGKVNMYLLGNDWYCNCDLKVLINLYDNNEDRFGDMPYCKGPLARYGLLFSNISFAGECDAKAEEENSMETTTIGFAQIESSPVVSSSVSSVLSPTAEISTTEEGTYRPSPFQMRCMSVLNLPSDEDSSSSEQMEYFLFAPPCHEFELILLRNNSVQIVIEEADVAINIVWFSDGGENFEYTIDGVTVDYNCEAYTDPYLIVDNLKENTTYTFCLVPGGIYSITPFNCLPLHVPIRINNLDSVWISNDEKQFTVGIVCLIFTCSMLLGGVIAFFGIKAYPDLLEGSKHVLVVKKSDQTCYVSTITEGEYIVNQTIKKNSLKKKGSLNKIPLPWSHSTPQFSSFPAQPPPVTPPSPPEQIPDQSLAESEDHYELPCIYQKSHECQLQCIPNKYAMSPMSPPPLPKRNSDVLLYSLNSELLPEKSQPKMSF